MTAAIGLGWRVHGSSAVLVAVTGTAASPDIVRREVITLVDDESTREPFHAAVGMPIDDVPAFVASVRAAAADVVVETIGALEGVAAVGVVGADRTLPDLARILTKHALLHAADRDLYERAIVDGATHAGVPVTTIPAVGTLLSDASAVLGVALAPVLAAVGRSIGPPWQKDHREATAAALVALHAQSFER